MDDPLQNTFGEKIRRKKIRNFGKVLKIFWGIPEQFRFFMEIYTPELQKELKMKLSIISNPQATDLQKRKKNSSKGSPF